MSQKGLIKTSEGFTSKIEMTVVTYLLWGSNVFCTLQLTPFNCCKIFESLFLNLPMVCRYFLLGEGGEESVSVIGMEAICL